MVSLGIYLFALEEGLAGVESKLALFVDADVEFSGVVLPGEKVFISAEKGFFSSQQTTNKGNDDDWRWQNDL